MEVLGRIARGAGRVAFPTTRDKPQGIGIVLEKPTELLLLPQAGASPSR
jgi:hypothetical protein